MGYQTIKEGISKMLVAKGFVDSAQVFNFKDESDQSVDKRFRLERPEIDIQADGVEFLVNLVRPVFRYRLSLGFKISEQKQVFDHDVAQNTIDVLLSYFNNPVNYTAFCIKMRVQNVKTALVDEHLEAVIELEVLDDITLT